MRLKMTYEQWLKANYEEVFSLWLKDNYKQWLEYAKESYKISNR